MAAAIQTVPALLTLDEFLHTAYHSDCGFVDGHLEERNLGDMKQSVIIRLKDFDAMGIPHIWLLDPSKRTAHIFNRDDLSPVEGSVIKIPGTPIHLDLPEVFSCLD